MLRLPCNRYELRPPHLLHGLLNSTLFFLLFGDSLTASRGLFLLPNNTALNAICAFSSQDGLTAVCREVVDSLDLDHFHHCQGPVRTGEKQLEQP